MGTRSFDLCRGYLGLELPINGDLLAKVTGVPVVIHGGTLDEHVNLLLKKVNSFQDWYGLAGLYKNHDCATNNQIKVIR